MLFDGIELINEEFTCDFARPDQMDALWEQGWRHFGTHFFRYNLGFYELGIRKVIPLRIRLDANALSKSQRRNLRRNCSFRVETGRLNLTAESKSLFAKHITRFADAVPESINDFVPDLADGSPCDTRQLSVFDGDTLIAESYFDIGESALSGIFAIFDPERLREGLGIFTLLREIEMARELGMKFYYLGYSYEGSSFYDYKKRFRGTEAFDWNSNWIEFVDQQ
jgi:leucyl-tRNA---protein transferase